MKKEHLSDYGIVKENTKTNAAFAKLITNFSGNEDIPSVYVNNIWNKYNLSKIKKSNSLNGYIFEAIIATLFIKEGILPMFLQASLEFVPDIDYDLIIFPKDENGEVDVSAPISLSLKTSLRERYKQADLEGLALKEVYKRAKTYLITIDEKQEIDKFKNKIDVKDVRGIDKCIDARSHEFDELIYSIKESGVAEPPDIRAIKDSSETRTKEIGKGK